MAFCRALATHDAREEVRGKDTLAELFVAEESRKSLHDPAARAWMIERFSGTYEFFVARTAYGDGVLQQALHEYVPQVVILGAEGALEEFLFRRGFRLLENLTPGEMEKRFLALRDGSLAGRVVVLFNLACAVSL